MLSLGILAAYLLVFALGTAEATRVTGRSAWLFGRAKGVNRIAAFGFCAAFTLAFLGVLAPHDGLSVGPVIAAFGGMIAFAAQMSMGASWRVGTTEEETGALVTSGMFRHSRNPTFLGQALLLAGVAMSIPSIPTVLAVPLFLAAASIQIHSEERLLSAKDTFNEWAAETPRWLPRGPWRMMLAALLADQATKAVALTFLTEARPVFLLPFFDLTLGFNTGASFGILSGAMADRPIVMALLTGAMTAGFAVMACRATSTFEQSGYALITGGAAGNIVDRLNQGAVTDFLDLHWQGWHWPAFNVADVAICLGAVLVVLATFPRKRTTHA